MKKLFSFIGLFIITLVISMFILNNNVQGELKMKDTQIKSLIREVGILQDKTEKIQGVLAVLRKMQLKKEDARRIMTATAFIEEDKIEKPKNYEAFLFLGTNQNLSDTIMLVIANKDKKTLNFISIPRDFSVQGRKINEIYEFYGADVLAENIKEITGIYVKKYTIIDMNGFEKTIDVLGGIDIHVEKDIVDYSYPNKKGGYAPYSIKKGDYHMNGAEALKYARSRKSTSDFDRAKRQQEVMKAIYAKVKQLNLIDNVNFITQAYNALLKNIETNMDLLEMIDAYRSYQTFGFNTGNVLSTENYLYSTKNSKGQYILLPREGKYAKIQEYVKNLARL